jgi:FemAB family protein
MLISIQNFCNLAASCGLLIKMRSDAVENWDSTLKQCAYAPVLYTNASIDFQLTNQKGHGGNWQDLSFLIYLDNKPIAIWPLSLAEIDGKTSLNSHGLPLFPPLFVADCQMRVCKRVIKNGLDFVDKLAGMNGLVAWECMESFTNSKGLSLWHAESMARGATCTVNHEVLLDLSLSMPEIKAYFRKSYKPLITAGMRLWQIDVLTTADETIWREFYDLHVSVAGRKTRSDETWDLHLQDIETQRGFLVYLRDNTGRMIGGGFFNVSPNEGFYAVAAYDRSLFDKPLGHVVQYRAIEELQKRGIRWYKIGVRSYPSHLPAPSAKEIAISEFKEGFASHLFPKFMLRHPTPQGLLI